MNTNKQWMRDPEHPTQWILNPNFRPSVEEPPSMQIQPIEEPIIQLPAELPQVETPSMQIQPIASPIIQLPVEVPQVIPPQVVPPKVTPPQVVPPQVVPPQVVPPQVVPPQVAPPQVVPPQVTPPQVAPPMQIQPIVDPVVQLPGLVVAPPTTIFHPGFFCSGHESCPHFSHHTQTPQPRGPLPVTPN